MGMGTFDWSSPATSLADERRAERPENRKSLNLKVKKVALGCYRRLRVQAKTLVPPVGDYFACPQPIATI